MMTPVAFSSVRLQAELWHEFWAMDANGDGRISVEEVKMDPMKHRHMDAEAVATTLAKVDVSGDGTVSFPEFLSFMKGCVCAGLRPDPPAPL